MNTKFFTFILLSFLAIGSVWAYDYMPDKTVSVDEFSETHIIEEDKENYVYSVTPTDHKLVRIVLSGSSDYAPSLLIYDPEEDEIIFTENRVSGNVITHDFIGVIEKREAKEYYLIVETENRKGMSFTLQYEAISQNDAGYGTDSTVAFREGFLLEKGTYSGFLGESDVVDNYRVQLKAEDELNLEIAPQYEGSLSLTLIDGEMNRKINKQSHDGNTIIASYFSPRDQTVYLGLEGDVPYSIVVDKAEDGVVDEPPLPPPVPGTEIEEPEPVIEVGDRAPDEEDEEEEYQDVVEEEGGAGFAIALVVILIIIVAVVIFYLKGKEPAEEKKVLAEEKKSHKKKAKKKKK